MGELKTLVFLHENDVIFVYLVVADPAVISLIILTNNSRTIFGNNCP